MSVYSGLLNPLVFAFQWALQPIAPFTWFGLGVSSLDVAAAFRLCIALRQLREGVRADYVKKMRSTPKGKSGAVEFEPKSFVKDLSTTLTVVYGGEVMTSPLLGLTPSFMVSGVVPILYAVIQAFVEMLPAVPAPSLGLEFPLSIFDGFSRAYLLCNLIPPAITANASPVIANSAWTLLLTSLMAANGGFFLTNMFSFLHPTPLTLTTPAELRPYGWTTTDLWCAPLITGLYALLTHAQPVWADLHTLLNTLLGGHIDEKLLSAQPLDPELARVVCALVLVSMFTTRTVKNFAGPLVFTIAEQKPRIPSTTVSSVRAASVESSTSSPPSASTRNKTGKTKIQ